jgi:hypothetical protein
MAKLPLCTQRSVECAKTKRGREMEEQFYDRPPVQPHGIRSKYTTYLTVTNKLGMVGIGIILVFLMTSLPSGLSILSRQAQRLERLDPSLSETDAEAYATTLQNICHVLEGMTDYYTFIARLIIGCLLGTCILFWVNLRCSRMLRELLLFGGKQKKKD